MSKINELKELLTPAIEETGYDCVDITFEKVSDDWILTAFIDNGGNIGLEDCEKVSRVLSDLLDETDPIEQSYLLEVSSPGIDRPLISLEDYKRALDTVIEVNLYQKVNGKKSFIGTLKDISENNINLETDDGEVELELNKISKAAPYISVE